MILSLLNGNVKMSPHETGDIHVESEETAAGDRNLLFFLRSIGFFLQAPRAVAEAISAAKCRCRRDASRRRMSGSELYQSRQKPPPRVVANQRSFIP
jgi:hypothetical protein